MNNKLFVEIVSSRIFTILLQLIYLKMYSNYVSIYDLGIYYTLITISYAINAFMLVPLDYFQQSRLYTLKENFQSIKSYLPINFFVVKVLLIILFISQIIVYFWNESMQINVLIIPFISLFTYLNTLMRGFLNNLEYRRNAIYTLILENTLKILVFMFFLQYYEANETLLLFSAVVGMGIISIILFYLLSKKIEYKNIKINSFNVSEIFHFSYPISFGAMINWVQLQGYRVLLAPLGFVELIGIYGTVSNIGHTGMGAASTVFSQVFVPDLYKTHGSYIKKYIFMALSVIAFVFIIGFFLRDEIVLLLTSAKFLDYAGLIGYGVLTEAGNFIVGGLSIYLSIHNLTKKTLLASLYGLLIFAIIFALLYFYENITIWTVGIPIVLSQIVVSIYLLYIVFDIQKKGEINV